jgi:single-stranded-DNA-specific exonuclease
MTIRKGIHWHEPLSTQPDLDFCRAVGGHPLISKLLYQRGYQSIREAQAFLQPDLYQPAPCSDLPDLMQAVSHLLGAIQKQQPILVWGDFDVDGQTSTALLVDALQRLGAQVRYYIPHRVRESHGIRLESLQAQLLTPLPAILLTCDTGVSAHVSIDYAKSKHITVLVTDHHDLPEQLPKADAVVNPKRLPKHHPLASLPGVGVAYKLIEQLYGECNRTSELPEFLDLVALGIVADVATQTHDTRYLLQIGLDQLRHSQRIGIRTLMDVAGLIPDQVTAMDIGFQLGPRLNAAGRLADARPVIELLTTSDQSRARLLAAELEGLNTQRRFQNRQIYAAAQEMIARDAALLDWEALVLAAPAWHPGLIGIVAGQLSDYYQRPVVLLSLSDDGTARGSARSVPGYDIGAAVAAQSELLLEYGGHPGAAGLSLHADNIPAFRRRLSNTLAATRDSSIQTGLQIDSYLPLNEITPHLVTEINRLAPFGEGNPRITLASKDLHLKSAAFLDRAQRHRRLTIEDNNGNRQQIIWWNSSELSLPDGVFDLAYEIDLSTYKGSAELQLTLVDYRRSTSMPVEVSRPELEIIDHRGKSASSVLALYPQAEIWAEGYRRSESPGIPLAELRPANSLLIYTTPPDPYTLQAAVKRAHPERIILLAIDPPLQTSEAVQRRILELLKYVLNQQNGQTSLDAIAVAVGQSRHVIYLALDYFIAAGEITVTWGEDGVIIVGMNDSPSADITEQRAAFEAAVIETAAYRAFFKRAALDWIKAE